MEREIDFGNEILMTQKIRENPKNEIEVEREKELADIVCIFTSPEQPGIMFYDRSPEPGSPVAKFAGSPQEGKYITDRASISVAEWDEDMHVANGDKCVRYREGAVKVTTIMVTEEKMGEIIDDIIKSEDPDRIVIDTRMTMINDIDISKVNYDNFKQARDDVMKNIEQYNVLTNLDVPGVNNIDTTGKGLK